MGRVAKTGAAAAIATAVALCWGWGTAAESTSPVGVRVDPACGSKRQARELMSVLRTRFPDRPVRRLRQMPEGEVAIVWSSDGRVGGRRADAGRGAGADAGRGDLAHEADGGSGAETGEARRRGRRRRPGESSRREMASPGRDWRNREIFPPDLTREGMAGRRRDADGCGLRVRGSGEEHRIDLSRDADSEAVYRAAVRAVWLLSDRNPLAPRGGDGGDEDQTSLDEIVPPPNWPEGDTGGEPDAGRRVDAGEGADAGGPDAGEPSMDAGVAGVDAVEADAGDGSAGDGDQTQWTDVEYQSVLFGPLKRPQYEEAERVVPDYALNVVGTEYGLDGAELALVMNKHDGFAHGLQVAGLANYVDGEASGLQTSLATNVTDADYEGVALAAGVNYAEELEGFQAALGGNLVGKATEGLQAAVGVNWTGGRVDGLQSAFLNAGGDVNGAQLGVVNIGRDIEGAQVGVFNVARKSTVSVGLISINWGRPLYVGLTQDVTGFALMELEHGSRRVHHILVAGIHPYNPNFTGSVGAGLGLDLGRGSLTVDVDLVGQLVGANAEPDLATSVWGQTRATAVWSLAKRFALTAGVSGNLLVGVGDPIVTAPAGLPTSRVDRNAWLWPGIHAGVRF